MTLLGLGKSQHSGSSGGGLSVFKQGSVPLGQPAEADKKKPNIFANLMMNMKKVPEKVEEEKDEEKKEESKEDALGQGT